jgi:hypothetical protein
MTHAVDLLPRLFIHLHLKNPRVIDEGKRNVFLVIPSPLENTLADGGLFLHLRPSPLRHSCESRNPGVTAATAVYPPKTDKTPSPSFLLNPDSQVKKTGFLLSQE